MSNKRFLVLTVGPLILIFLSYWVTFELPRTSSASTIADSNGAAPLPTVAAPSSLLPRFAQLQKTCQQAAGSIARRLGDGHHAIAKAPFVIAGDMPESDLREFYQITIRPIHHALHGSYFETPPDQPVTLVLLRSADQYRRVAQLLDGYDALRYHGYYRREERRIVLDLSSGNGTLAHELTHALMAFDFPAAPEWFDEGLASLHEEAEFAKEGTHLLGRHNWRFHALKQAAQTGQFKSLRQIITTERFRQDGEGLHYAFVRYFCLYLQHRGLLQSFYHQFRGASETDAQGEATLCRLFGYETLEEIDDDFRFWLKSEFRKFDRANR